MCHGAFPFPLVADCRPPRGTHGCSCFAPQRQPRLIDHESIAAWRHVTDPIELLPVPFVSRFERNHIGCATAGRPQCKEAFCERKLA
jgi:hypothetical protein